MPKRELSKEFKDRIGHPPTHTTRNAVKKEARLAEAREYGRIIGEWKANQKIHQISLDEKTGQKLLTSLQQHIGRSLDKMSAKDWLDVVAALGLTPLVYLGVKDLSALASFVQTSSTITSAEGPVASSMFALPTIFGGILSTLNGIIPFIHHSPDVTFDSAGAMAWMLAFAISWCIVKFGDKMITAGVGSLSGILAMIGISL
jgi:hypothetical protein